MQQRADYSMTFVGAAEQCDRECEAERLPSPKAWDYADCGLQ
jgi:hypothetical protein